MRSGSPGPGSSPGHVRAQTSGVDRHLLVEGRIRIGDQGAPVIDGRIEVRGARCLPRKYSNVVSSGPIIPARAPASMLMLQIVIRCSMLQRLDGRPAILDDVP